MSSSVLYLRVICHDHKDACAHPHLTFVVFSLHIKLLLTYQESTQAAAIMEDYHLEAISHHPAPNWTVCLLHFHFPLSALSASLWDRPEKWHSLRLIEHPRAQTKLTDPHAGATHGRPDSLLLLCLLVKERKRKTERTGWTRLAWGDFFLTYGCVVSLKN